MSEITNTKDFGPNVQRLIARKMALDAVPRGGGFNDALDPLIRNAIYTALFALAKSETSATARYFCESHLASIPDYWETPKTTTDFEEFVALYFGRESELGHVRILGPNDIQEGIEPKCL